MTRMARGHGRGRPKSVIVSSSGAPATFNYYVSTTGADTNDGLTLSTPFRTIGKAATVLSAGQRVGIRAGTYAESLQWFGWPGGTLGTSWSNAITFAAYNSETVRVQPSSAGFALVARQSSNGATDAPRYIAFEDIIFDGRNCSEDVVKIMTNDLSDAANAARYFRFTRGRMTSVKGLGHTQQGILTTWGAVGCELIGVEIDNVGDNAAAPNSQGIYGGAHDMLIDGCHVHDVDGFGISCLNSNVGLHVDNHICRNNRVHDCGKTSSQLGGINYGEGTGHQIYNNLVYNNLGRGIAIAFEASTGIKVYSNTVYGNATAGLYTDGAQSGTTFRNNISYANSPNYENNGTGTVEDHNSLDGTNPQFANAAGGDFHLTASTPGSIVNAGVALAEVLTDADGVTRANPPDIGAYEKV